MPDEQTSSSGLKDTSGAGTVRIVGAGKFGGSSEVRKRAGDVAEHKRALARAKRLLAVALEDEDTGTRDWFPKSQITFDRKVKDGVSTVKIPYWLLKQKGWSD